MKVLLEQADLCWIRLPSGSVCTLQRFTAWPCLPAKAVSKVRSRLCQQAWLTWARRPSVALAADTGLIDCECRLQQEPTFRWMWSDHRYVVAARARAEGDDDADAAAQTLAAEGGWTDADRLED